MSIMTMNVDTLSAATGHAVPDIYVTIAKNHVAGLDKTAISDLLGVDVSEIEEILADQIFKDVRLLIASEYARTQVEADFSWDGIESEALKGLAKRVHLERDTDTLLRIAAVANKAQRRTNPKNNGVLDPAAGGQRVAINLTQRFVKKLAKDGSQEVEETRQISLMDGSAKNPTFEDIDRLLGVSLRPAIPGKMAVHTHESDFSLDDIPEFKK